MAAVQLAGNYYTRSVALANNSQTVLYTCGTDKELAFDVTGLSVAATRPLPTPPRLSGIRSSTM